MTIDEILDASGYTMDDIIAASFPESMAEDLAAAMNQEGKFEAKNNQLFTSQSVNSNVDPGVYETYELVGDTMTITGASSSGTMGIYPLVFNRVG